MRLVLTSLVLCVLWTGIASAQPFAYITNEGSNSVSVIDTATNIVVKTIPSGLTPLGIAVNPDGSFVYVTNGVSGTVSVIDTSTNTVVGTPIAVGNTPIALGKFIQPPPPPINTPTLSEWGLIAMAGILGIVGFMVIRRRKVTA